jgi:2-oxoglutarate ferredoxin oxidoreductase subunit alpha
MPYRPDRGKMLSAEELASLDKFYRYVDRDDDAIPYRTLPGVSPKGAYFTRGSGHNQYGAYTEDSAEYQVVLDRLKRKFSTAARYVPKPEIIGKGDSKIGIVSVGSCDGAVREAIDVLARQKIAVDYMRIKAFPFGHDVESFLSLHATIFVVEQNRDAQLRSLLTLETAVDKSKLKSILSPTAAFRCPASPSSTVSAPRFPMRRGSPRSPASTLAKEKSCHSSTSPKSPILRCRPTRSV